MERPVGRRERKKAATRALILAAATKLFLERGFDGVSVREIADAADVAPKTVFSHFPRKEALVFSDEDERHDRLIRAITERGQGASISEALANHYRHELAALRSGAQLEVLTLMHNTPTLVEYAERMWFTHEHALATAIATELGRSEPDETIRLWARFALQIQLSASQSSDPDRTIEAGFALLDEGWKPTSQRPQAD